MLDQGGLGDAFRCRVQSIGTVVSMFMCAWVWLSTERAQAQDIQRFWPALGANGFLGIDGTRTPGAGRWSLNAFTDLAVHPVEQEGIEGEPVPVETRLMLHLGGELGLTSRASVAVRVPLIAYQDGEVPFVGGERDAQVFVLTDPQFWFRYHLYGAASNGNNIPLDGPGLTFAAGVTAPLGKKSWHGANSGFVGASSGGGQNVGVFALSSSSAYASDDAVRAEASLLADFQLLGAGAALLLGYRHHFWKENYSQQQSDLDPTFDAQDAQPAVSSGPSGPWSATRVSDEFLFGTALKSPIPGLPFLTGIFELRGITGFSTAASTVIELNLGGRTRLGPFQLVLGGGFGLTKGVGSPDGRVLFGAYYEPPLSDADHDGVDDSKDACKFLAEDRDGFQDDDGCPDPDNDGDLVPDVDDKCPNTAAEEGRDEDEDGCTDP